MKLTCPCCGAVASAEAWQNDLEARAVLAAAIKLDEPIPRQLLPYLGLFRPAERSLSWKRTATLIRDLSKLVATGYVQVHGRPARPCPPHVWAQAMEQMADRGMTISRPMTNHNYLRQVAWQLADKLDAELEARQYREERDGTARANRQYDRQIEQQEQIEMSQEDMDALDKMGVGESFRKLQETLNKKRI